MSLFRNSRIFGIVLIAFLSISMTNCVHVHSTKRTTVKAKRIPPGHAKKMSGDKSARRHAPGHNK